MNRMEPSGEEPQVEVVVVKLDGEEEATVILAAVCALDAAISGEREHWLKVMKAVHDGMDRSVLRRVHKRLHVLMGDDTRGDPRTN